MFPKLQVEVLEFGVQHTLVSKEVDIVPETSTPLGRDANLLFGKLLYYFLFG